MWPCRCSIIEIYYTWEPEQKLLCIFISALNGNGILPVVNSWDGWIERCIEHIYEGILLSCRLGREAVLAKQMTQTADQCGTSVYL